MNSSNKEFYFLDEITINTLKVLIDILEKSSLSSIHYEQESNGVRYYVELSKEPRNYLSSKNFSSTPVSDQESFAELIPSSPERISEKSSLYWVRSPLVGTAYSASKPGASSLVNVGDHVTVGAPLLIIEAMKVMNIIKSPVSGCVRKISFSDGHPVEYDEPLLGIEATA
ncbi:acetyl-CoA carboxylase biotin carboxyl carrier protein [Holospora curviuscula]|uniref:Biotin carboxyl carrier protein of acetyl-CoA carboxylase n=1 Tax=Holospora curviuscula TaxID=1082868 RepID=A0A2S5REC3_9PROT|nr:acetyl-CoA carboxylase biotin carboxyl carrier protein subunit [Holospora curviuscula]PPE05679.1 Biotin carboxyl carrier protein of acetyl-CoA carboxylase [Holospora curviuscula]